MRSATHASAAVQEMIGSDDYGKSVDWWSLGTLLYEMLHGLPPFYSKNRREMAMRITTAKLTFPDNFSASVRCSAAATVLPHEGRRPVPRHARAVRRVCGGGVR